MVIEAEVEATFFVYGGRYHEPRNTLGTLGSRKALEK